MKGTLENFDKIGSLHLVWLPQVFASVRFPYSSDFYQKLTHCIAWADEKNAGLPNFPFLIGKKLLSFKNEVSPILKLNWHFKAKLVKIDISSWITYYLAQIKSLITPRFFLCSRSRLCQNLIKIGWLREKMRSRTFWYSYRAWNGDFCKNFICPLFYSWKGT